MAELEPTDAGQLHLKKRARRRLVGAAALALLAVIVLPMVMDEAPKTLSQDIQISIPSKDGPTAPRLAQASPEAKAIAKTEAKSEARAEAPAAVAAPLAAAAKVGAAVEAPANAKAAPEPKAAMKPEPQAEIAPPPKLAPQPPAKSEDKPVAAAEAKVGAKAEGKTESKAEVEQWVVQLGAYQDQGNVRAILAKIKELRYPAYTEKVETEQGSRTRVRAGPFASREKAEKAQAALKRIAAGGPSGGVVAPK